MCIRDRVQGDLRGERHRVGRDGVQAAVVGRDEQDVGDGRVGDAGQLAAQGAVLQPYGLPPGIRGRVQPHGEGADGPAGGQLSQQFLVAGGQQGLGGHDRAGEVGHGCDRSAQLLQDHGDLAGRGALAALRLGDQQAGEAHAVRECLPGREVVRGVGLGAGDDAGRVAVVGEQVPYGGPQRLFLLRVQQVGHRARSFHATSLSVRGSAGRPRTRSATMFSRTSLVPPSMLLPLERR